MPLADLPADAHVEILHCLGFLGGGGRDPTREAAGRCARVAGAPFVRRSPLIVPWLPRRPLEGRWLAPLPSQRVLAAYGHQRSVLCLRSSGLFATKPRDNGAENDVPLAVDVVTAASSDAYVAVLRGDGSVSVWLHLEGPPLQVEPSGGGAVDLVAGRNSFLVRRGASCSLFDVHEDGRLRHSWTLDLACSHACTYRRHQCEAEVHYALRTEDGYVYELSPPRAFGQRRIWPTPVGCGALELLSSKEGEWASARRELSSVGGSVRDLGCGYACTGASACLVLGFATLLGPSPDELLAQCREGFRDATAVVSAATATHFHLLLALLQADSCHVWTWCRQWQWLHQRRVALEVSLDVVLAPTRYLALPTSRTEWLLFDAAYAHAPAGGATSHRGTQLAFVQAEGDEYALVSLRDGAVAVELAPHSDGDVVLPLLRELKGLEGPGTALRSLGPRGVARIADDGSAAVFRRGSTMFLRGPRFVYDVLRCQGADRAVLALTILPEDLPF